MLKLLLSLCALTLSFSATAKTMAGEEDAIMIEDAWAKVSFKNGAAYMHIQNGDTYATNLVKAESPIAKRVEIHNVIKEDGVFKMIHLGDKGISIPAGEMAVLKPNGYHIMVFGLEKMLKPGDKLPLTLTFDAGAPELNVVKQINVIVKPINHQPDHSKHDGHDHSAH